MTETEQRERLVQQGELSFARQEYNVARVGAERQAKYAEQCVYQENYAQALIHAEALQGHVKRADKARARLDKLTRRLAKAVPDG